MPGAGASIGGGCLRLLWLSVAAALSTIALSNHGPYADRVRRSVVRRGGVGGELVAAVVAWRRCAWRLKPADEDHAYGHQKAEYFSAGVEGALVVVAAVASAWPRSGGSSIHSRSSQSASASQSPPPPRSINLAVGIVLLRAGRRERSIVLGADGRHLITDVWTSTGVIVGVAAVALTGWERLDPLVALAVAATSSHRGRAHPALRRRADGPRARRRSIGGSRRCCNDFRSRGRGLPRADAGAGAALVHLAARPGAGRVEGPTRPRPCGAGRGAAAQRVPQATVFTHVEPARTRAPLHGARPRRARG